ncbi:MAG: two-component regulator propeller domain-containing protein [Bacteroidota bacterium]
MRKIWVILLPLMVLTGITSGRIVNTPAFRAVSPPEGFTYSAVITITEDPTGIIWFGTQHGLYSYDTESFRKYLHQPGNSNSPSGNHIRNLFCDSSGKMWISTNNGLCYYDFGQERFVRCNYTDDEGLQINRNILQVFEDKARRLWLIDNRGLARIDTLAKTFRYRDFSNAPTGVSYARIAADGSLWLGTNEGSVFQSNYPYETLTLFSHFRQAIVQSILPVRNSVWIGYDWGGADKAGYDGKLQVHYSESSETGNTISNDRVRDFYEDPAGRIWMATYKGLTIVQGNEILNFDRENYPGINHNSIYTFYEDFRGGLWLGTWSGGLYYMNMHDNNFIHIRDIFTPVLNTNVVSSFTDGPGDQVWVGTESGLMFSYHVGTQEYKKHNFSRSGDQVNNIKSLYSDSRGNIWMGTFSGGIWLKKPENAEFVRVPYLMGSRPSIYGFAEDQDKMWIATFGNGLHSYSPLTGETEHFTSRSGDPASLSNNSLRSVLVDRSGNLWVGTMYGLNLRKPGDNGFTRFLPDTVLNPYTINHHEVFCLHQDRSGNIWIGTGGGGLNRYDQSTGKFEHFDNNTGFSGREIYGILEDHNGNLWVSTEAGITFFDPKSKSARNFVREDGLQGNQFNPGSFFRSKHGLMFFGGSNGFTCFSPGNIKTNPVPPHALITSIQVNHEELVPGIHGSPLKQSIRLTDQIILKSRQNSLTLSFVAINYLQPNKNRFRYRLLNYDENWVEAGSERKATFTKIPPGKYVFEVMAANNDGVWNTEPKRLTVRIRYPVLLRWYSLGFYILLIMTAVYFVQKEIRVRQRLRLEVREERLRREHEEMLGKMKMRFLTNITHEFKTPLSLIISPANQLYNRYYNDTDSRFLLEILKRNTTRLQWLISQVIDLRKIDMNKLDIVIRVINVVKLCHKISEYFMADARDKNIRLEVVTDLTEIYLETDQDKLDIIITNMVSNAMKFTPENGAVSIAVGKQTDGCEESFQWKNGSIIHGPVVRITVSDTGPGIPEREIPEMFERFVQGKGHEIMGTGIGLSVVKEYVRLLGGFIGVNSLPGEGTAFTVCFPWQDNLTMNDSVDQLAARFPQDESGDIPFAKSDADEENYTILLVEDDAETRNYIAGILRRHFRVISATNGKQGFEKALVTSPDIIVSDVVMPGTSGFEMSRLLKENEQTSHIPVIMITAQHDTGVEIESLASGADAIISKPFPEELLIAHIRKLLLSSRQKRKMESEENDLVNTAEESEYIDSQLVEKAIRIIDQNLLKSDFGVDKLASDLNMSRTSLYRKLKTLTGQSATEFIRYVRLKKALSLMETSDLSIEEVSIAVGFNSHSYFSHCFRQHFGKTPSEYLTDNKT